MVIIEQNVIQFLIETANAPQIESATTSKAGGMRMAPGRGRGHLCWWPLIFKKNFLIVTLVTSYIYVSNIFVTLF
jgi:hypothetical protein